MELSELVTEIKKEGKLSSEDILKIMTEAVEDGDDAACTFEKIYKKAYGAHLSEKLCMAWVKEMTHGEKWTYEQTTEVGQKNNINWSVMNKYEWMAAMNMAYSDFYKVSKDYQIEDDPDFFAELAKAFWLEDDDAHDKTICSYYFNYVA